MSRTITIDPVTRIEGHSKITIQLDERGEVTDAHFHVTQFRGFERIVQGRPVHEMPAIMARICGICPVSHLVASAKAVDDILAVDPPPTGADLRRLINLGQIVQSNALSFFHLSSPDLLFGFDADPSVRHIVAVAQKNPQLAHDGIAPAQVGPADHRAAGRQAHPSLGHRARRRGRARSRRRSATRSWPACRRPSPSASGPSPGTRRT